MKQKTFTLFWLTGKTQLVTGYDAASAMNSAGIGAGALRAMDFFAPGDRRNDYSWNAERHTWEKVKQAETK